MSKLDELIKKLCPDGVEYKKVAELTKSICTGLNPRDNFRLNTDDASYYYVTVKEFTTGTIKFTEKTDRISKEACSIIQKRSNLEKGDVLLSGIGTIGKVALVDIPTDNFNCSESVYLIKLYDTIINPKFFIHILRSEKIQAYFHSTSRGSTLKGIRMQDLKSLEIPVPPLEIQNEIVQILDKFTSLEAELEAELEARRKQYEYYRDSLLLENKNAEWKTLSEIGTFERGRRFVHGDDREEGTPCIHYGELYTYYGVWANEVKTHIDPNLKTKLRFADKNDVIIVGAGENNIDIGIAVAWLGDYKVAIHDACYIFRHNQNPKYISYLLRTYNYHLQIKKYVSEGKICSISAEGIGKAKLPFPSLEEQERIVSILDRFESLCNDITSGLPAEIEARHKQYEYYRDKLLTFKRKEA